MKRPVVERRLADDVASTAEHPVAKPGDVVGIGLDDLVALVKDPACFVGKDQVERARLRRADNEVPLPAGHAASPSFCAAPPCRWWSCGT